MEAFFRNLSGRRQNSLNKNQRPSSAHYGEGCKVEHDDDLLKPTLTLSKKVDQVNTQIENIQSNIKKDGKEAEEKDNMYLPEWAKLARSRRRPNEADIREVRKCVSRIPSSPRIEVKQGDKEKSPPPRKVPNEHEMVPKKSKVSKQKDMLLHLQWSSLPF